MKKYKSLNKNIFNYKEYSLVPIRFEDRFAIMKWRNEQIYHLRQAKPLTEEDQENYFNTVVSQLFEQEKPSQILFSFLKDKECIGYGGLVHINWIDKNAEISFIMETSLEKESFEKYWTIYLSLIEQVAFQELGLHKIYTYAFDLRPHLYDALESAGFEKDAVLKEHCYFENKFIDVVIHSKINTLKLRSVSSEDLEITFKWALNPKVREYSFNQNLITKEEHTSWFRNKIHDENCIYLILEDNINTPLGSIRLDISNKKGVISYLIDPAYHGRGLGTIILKELESYLIKMGVKINSIIGYVMLKNQASIKIFEKLGYQKIDETPLKFEKAIK